MHLYKKVNGKLLFESNITAERWIEYVRNLYADESRPELKNTNIDEDTATIKSEVRQTIKDMKAGIAPGMDGVDNIELVTYICQRAYQSGYIVTSMKHS